MPGLGNRLSMCLACPTRLPRRALLAATLLAPAAASATAAPDRLVEPRIRLRDRPPGDLPVAVTLDACGGGFDTRIAEALVEAQIPATVFATETWLRRNAAALGFLLAHPAIFGLENHGARHVPAVLGARSIFGLQAAGDMAAIRQEVIQGAAALHDAAGVTPRWFRGATGQYSPAALPEIAALGFAVAGFSLNADDGAQLPAVAVAARIAAARPGDIILAHLNQPGRGSGPGVAAGLRALQARGARFVRLDRLAPEEVVPA
jgi:peptidoglycan/xylan/chitin deacetylase (PgdA/CDA1 family)